MGSPRGIANFLSRKLTFMWFSMFSRTFSTTKNWSYTIIIVFTNPFTIGGKPLLFLGVRGSPFSSLQKGNSPEENAYHKKSPREKFKISTCTYSQKLGLRPDIIPYQSVKNFVLGHSKEVVIVFDVIHRIGAEVDKPADWPICGSGKIIKSFPSPT